MAAVARTLHSKDTGAKPISNNDPFNIASALLSEDAPSTSANGTGASSQTKNSPPSTDRTNTSGKIAKTNGTTVIKNKTTDSKMKGDVKDDFKKKLSALERLKMMKVGGLKSMMAKNEDGKTSTFNPFAVKVPSASQKMAKDPAALASPPLALKVSESFKKSATRIKSTLLLDFRKENSKFYLDFSKIPFLSIFNLVNFLYLLKWCLVELIISL